MWVLGNESGYFGRAVSAPKNFAIFLPRHPVIFNASFYIWKIWYISLLWRLFYLFLQTLYLLLTSISVKNIFHSFTFDLWFIFIFEVDFLETIYCWILELVFLSVLLFLARCRRFFWLSVWGHPVHRAGERIVARAWLQLGHWVS